MELKRICVFCGSSLGTDDAYRKEATRLAETLISNNIELVYGGAKVGIMKVLADNMLHRNGRVTGVMPRSLVDKEIAHTGLSKLHIVESMQERKLLMAEISDAFIAFPGGFGTLDEMAEMITFNQLRIHDKALGILNIKSFFDKLIKFFEHAVQEGFIRQEHIDNLIIAAEPENLIEKIKDYEPLDLDKWIKDIRKESAV
ncbi:MAG: TIGR00730 family Rossman fold protein [Bacteroidales bacterium]|nr:TIGR00730 family Rossman fold protein [Bacteroidales bacterium]MCF8388511.1 TIGR00730 family Rossman fold protein [Bacteroidales bacterium]MCF8399576.1 TIGR00730 family Rossman fold protein [Bacteroidales bacterium]